LKAVTFPVTGLLSSSPVTGNVTVEIFTECATAEDKAMPYRQFQDKGNAKMTLFPSLILC